MGPPQAYGYTANHSQYAHQRQERISTKAAYNTNGGSLVPINMQFHRLNEAGKKGTKLIEASRSIYPVLVIESYR